jgi:hypothetical protein
MSTSLLYHAFGIRGYHYTRTDYQGGQTILAHVGQVVADLTPRIAHRYPGVARLTL